MLHSRFLTLHHFFVNSVRDGSLAPWSFAQDSALLRYHNFGSPLAYDFGTVSVSRVTSGTVIALLMGWIRDDLGSRCAGEAEAEYRLRWEYPFGLFPLRFWI
jgi:hypothetical protein